jgi:hypothetical protein
MIDEDLGFYFSSDSLAPVAWMVELCNVKKLPSMAGRLFLIIFFGTDNLSIANS